MDLNLSAGSEIDIRPAVPKPESTMWLRGFIRRQRRLGLGGPFFPREASVSSRSLSTASTTQGEQWKADYERDGFIIVKDAFSKAEVSALSEEIVSIAKGERGEVKGLVQSKDAGQAPDSEVVKRYLAFHHPHKVSELYKSTMSHPAITNVLTSIVSENVKTMQSMFFVKGPRKPGQAWHQDEIYIPTRDRSLVGAWIALDDATISNGCLFIHPGSHKPGVLHQMKPHSDPRFDPAGESFGFDGEYDPEGGDAVEVKAGTVVFFHGYVLHRSLPNVTDDQFRRALVIHYCSAESLLPWDCDGTIPATEDNRDVLMVAGRDPYEHKGYVEDNTYPFIRPDTGTIQDAGSRGMAAVE